MENESSRGVFLEDKIGVEKWVWYYRDMFGVSTLEENSSVLSFRILSHLALVKVVTNSLAKEDSQTYECLRIFPTVKS